MEKDFRFLIYKSEEEDISVDAVVKDESIWLSKRAWLSCLVVPRITFRFISKTYLRTENWIEWQLPRKSRQLPQTGKNI